MAAQDGLTFEGTFNNSSTGLFKTNASQAIGSDDQRALVTAIKESYLNRIDDVLDEDDMASNSAAAVPTQQSVKAYVDAQVASGGTSTPYGATTGTNTYSATMSPVVSAYADGQMYHIRVGNSSTGLVTIDLGPGAKKAFDTSGAQIQDGYLKAGVDYVIVYNSTLDAAAGGFTVVNEVIHGFMNLRATYTTGTGLWPSTGGSGPSSGIRHGDTFIAGSNMTLGAKVVNTGDFITTMVDAPGQTDASWYVIPGPEAQRRTRTVTGASASLQSDDNSLIIFNSATPFNFTLDQLTANSKISFINYGAGAVTFANGTGVTAAGDLVLAAASGNEYPSCLVIWDTATTPRVITSSGTTVGAQSDKTPSGTTQTINWQEGDYVILNTGSASGNITLTLQNPVKGRTYLMKVVHGATQRNLVFPTGTIQQGGGGVNYTASAANATDYIYITYDGTNYNISVAPLWS